MGHLRRPILYGVVLVAVTTVLAIPSLAQGKQRPVRKPDVPFVGSVDEVVYAMLKTAGVTAKDVVYDLGCGDGRIVIAAARHFGARGIGVDINPRRIRESRQNALKAEVGSRVTFLTQDLFETDLSKATVVALYLDPKVNLRLRPKLLRELRPGARVVSNSFDMGDWKPDQVVRLSVAGSVCVIYYWVIPEAGKKPRGLE